MKLSEGVEQAIHSVTMLAALPPGGVLSAASLAMFHGVSPSYLLKHLQALSRAGIVQTHPGARGGYALAKDTAEVTLLDVVLAVEGAEPAFRCKEIRRNGPNPLPEAKFSAPCGINAAMLRAERAYRAALREVTLSDLLTQLDEEDDGAIAARGCAFFEAHMRQTNQSQQISQEGEK